MAPITHIVSETGWWIACAVGTAIGFGWAAVEHFMRR